MNYDNTLKVLEYCDFYDLLNLIQTCKHYYEIIPKEKLNSLINKKIYDYIIYEIKDKQYNYNSDINYKYYFRRLLKIKKFLISIFNKKFNDEAFFHISDFEKSKNIIYLNNNEPIPKYDIEYLLENSYIYFDWIYNKLELVLTDYIFDKIEIIEYGIKIGRILPKGSIPDIGYYPKFKDKDFVLDIFVKKQFKNYKISCKDTLYYILNDKFDFYIK
jgi:hypothetical protein